MTAATVDDPSRLESYSGKLKAVKYGGVRRLAVAAPRCSSIRSVYRTDGS